MIWFNDEDFDHKSKTPAITSYIEALSIRKDLDNGKITPMRGFYDFEYSGVIVIIFIVLKSIDKSDVYNPI